MTISIPVYLGFGFCPGYMHRKKDGGLHFTFRYIPPRLYGSNDALTVANINEAAARGALGDTLTEAEIPEDGIPPADAFTPSGKAYFESLPKYGELFIKEPYFHWTQYWEGAECFTLRANQFEPMLEEVLKSAPQHLWALKTLDGYHDFLYHDPQHGPIAMSMRPPLPQDSPKEVEDGWELGFDVARVDPVERVEYPNGLHRALYVAPRDGLVDHFTNVSKVGTMIEGSLGVLYVDQESFTWSPHYVMRMDAPCIMLPGVMAWLKKEDIPLEGPGQLLTIEPCHARFIPLVNFQKKPEEAGWRVAVISRMPLDQLDPTWLAWIEDEARKQAI